MKTKRCRVFLLLEDDTIGSLMCERMKSPSRYQGKKVIFATPQLSEIDILRLMLKSTAIGS
jgi:ERCC4-related helicase